MKFISVFQIFLTAIFGVTNSINAVETKSFLRTKKGRAMAAKAAEDEENEGVIFIYEWHSQCDLRDRTGRVIVMMATWNPIVRASVNPPHDAEGKATLGETIQTAAAKTLYVTIDPILYGTVLTGFISAMRKAKGANQVIKAWNDLNGQLNKIKAVVQLCMDEDITDSAAIICEYYAFHVIGKGGRTINVFSGEPGTEVGTIDLILPVGPDGCAYSIKLYNAARTSFAYAQATDVAHATIGGLVPGSNQAVSVTHVIHGVAQDESQIIMVSVKQ